MSPKSTVPLRAPGNVSCPDLDLIRNRYPGEDNDSIEFLPGPTAAFPTDRMNTPAKWYLALLFRGKEKFLEDRVSFTPHETTRQSFFRFEMSLLLSCPLPFTRIRVDAALEKKRKMPHLSPAKHLTGGPENEIHGNRPWLRGGRMQQRVRATGISTKKCSDTRLFLPGFLEFDEDWCNGTGINTPFGQFCEPAYILYVCYLKAYQKAKTERYDHNCEITDRVNHGPLPLHPNTRVSS